jgi:NAD(P)-dependent dehydrogenase (short-subunit alcohol dehydrogenase family)
MACPFAVSKDDIESQMATNHFSHAVLTNKLLPVLIKSQPSRIVVLSSLAHTMVSEISYKNLMDEKVYVPWKRYGETKLANLHFTRYLQQKLDAMGSKADKVYVNAVHPGIVKTELERNLAEKDKGFQLNMAYWFEIDPERGAVTQTYVAGSTDIEEKGYKGRYFVPYAWEASPSAAALNNDYVKQTWEWTEKVLQEKFRPDWKWAI